MPKINVATCQFPVGANIDRNAGYMRQLTRSAGELGADVVHFSECALSGYAGSDFDTWDNYDWDLLRESTLHLCKAACEAKLWLVVGSSHPLSGDHLPHNCLYVIDPAGDIVERYDKRFCTRSDLRLYSPGNHCSVVEINGVQCGFCICYDVRFPELFREYKRLDAQCLFHSFYNARATGRNIHTTIMRPSLQARAASNAFWISANNSSSYYQSWPGVFITPDGTIADALRQHRSGIMVNTVDTEQTFYDASKPFRSTAISGILHSGMPVRDERSSNRQCL